MIRDKDFITRYIEANPQKSGRDEVRLKEFGVSVWALIGYLQAVHGNIDQVAEDYGLPREAVEAAIAYYEQHRILIDARIAANDPNSDDMFYEA